jgi:Fe-S oxidoreductase
VFEALELCLSCKGCKGDCPVNVDMATYKAEFLSHYYRGRLRPRVAYAMGLIAWWARLAARAPTLANATTHAPGVGRVLKFAAGVAREREIPRFAGETFVRWFRRRASTNGGAPVVLLWPDTFINFFQPWIGRAAVEVLEGIGFRVAIPGAAMCCGRPLYDYGMLDWAERWLQRILEELRPWIRAGVPVVGVEPSCMAVFRDELPNLFPHDEDARRLSNQAFLLPEFLAARAPVWVAPPMEPRRRALVHGHCHQKAVLGMNADRALMDALGLDYEVLDSGCCGMAGSFGFEAGEKYEVSVRAGERVLLPKVREAPPDTLIVANGFSCRTQIEQGTGRRALHLAEVISMAMGERSAESDGEAAPMAVGSNGRPNGRATRTATAAAALAAAGAAGALSWRARPRRD